MKLVQTIKELQSELDALRSEGKTIGLVPTMGALHAGHASFKFMPDRRMTSCNWFLRSLTLPHFGIKVLISLPFS